MTTKFFERNYWQTKKPKTVGHNDLVGVTADENDVLFLSVFQQDQEVLNVPVTLLNVDILVAVDYNGEVNLQLWGFHNSSEAVFRGHVSLSIFKLLYDRSVHNFLHFCDYLCKCIPFHI